ncbi:MAG: HEAT repeat domain-containing protein [Nitrospira sp.]|nr:HEAT repeat domain-containing protein [Nitrospira sp.]
MKDERWRVWSMRRKPAVICARRAVDGLLFACRDRDGAVKALRRKREKIGDAKAVPALVKLFRDSSKIVRETAGIALVAVGQPSVDLLLETMKDKDLSCAAMRLVRWEA